MYRSVERRKRGNAQRASNSSHEDEGDCELSSAGVRTRVRLPSLDFSDIPSTENAFSRTFLPGIFLPRNFFLGIFFHGFFPGEFLFSFSTFWFWFAACIITLSLGYNIIEANLIKKTFMSWCSIEVRGRYYYSNNIVPRTRVLCNPMEKVAVWSLAERGLEHTNTHGQTYVKFIDRILASVT